MPISSRSARTDFFFVNKSSYRGDGVVKIADKDLLLPLPRRTWRGKNLLLFTSSDMLTPACTDIMLILKNFLVVLFTELRGKSAV